MGTRRISATLPLGAVRGGCVEPWGETDCGTLGKQSGSARFFQPLDWAFDCWLAFHNFRSGVFWRSLRLDCMLDGRQLIRNGKSNGVMLNAEPVRYALLSLRIVFKVSLRSTLCRAESPVPDSGWSG